MTLLDHALHYAESGYPIFPVYTIVDGHCSCWRGASCHSPGKHPIPDNGFKDGTTDVVMIKKWWEQSPSANIGLWCRGLIVVDVDPRNGGDESLEELFSTVADKHGFDTLTAITGGNGRHYIFNAPDDANYDCKPSPGIEIKSSGGLIVAVPSVHISGRRYEWEDASAKIAPAPQWLLNLIKKPSRKPPPTNFTGKPLDLEYFIAKHGIKTDPPKVSRCDFGGYQWDIQGGCPFQPEYKGGSPAIGVTEAGAFWFACFCGDHGKKTWADFRKIYEPGYLNGNHAQTSNEAPPLPVDEEPDEHPLRYTPWPSPLSDAAFHGILGELCKIIEPATESDISAVLFQALVMIGNVFGRGAHFSAESTQHFCNEFVCIVGSTAKGRKGSSFGQVRHVLSQIDSNWNKFRIKSGLSSGEGLIYHVRDEVREMKTHKGKTEEVITDVGEPDKRMLVVEEELSGAFKAMAREGNNLSGILRQAWDSPLVLSPMTKNNRIVASRPHVSIIGHITKDELLKSLKSVENTNGSTNRFLWCCAKRSKLLPFGGKPDREALAAVASAIDCAVGWAQSLTSEIEFDGEATEMWSIVYEELGNIPSGTIGAILSRAEPHVRRVAMIYAALDRSPAVRAEHLEAALEVWRYSSDSVKWIFDSSERSEGEQLKLREKIMNFIVDSPTGRGRGEIRSLLGGAIKWPAVEFHLEALLNSGKLVARIEKRTRKSCEFYYSSEQMLQDRIPETLNT